tara:strand:+ start:292 stop:816 length:525 start_codon:yes stop_codon:yes gene_type:complete
MVHCKKEEPIFRNLDNLTNPGSESHQSTQPTGERCKVSHQFCSFCSLTRALPRKPNDQSIFFDYEDVFELVSGLHRSWCVWRCRGSNGDDGTIARSFRHSNLCKGGSMTFEWDQPYDASDLEPQQIRDDFSEMIAANDDKNHPGIEGRILDGLACWLPSSVLAEFMDDLAMGRV